MLPIDMTDYEEVFDEYLENTDWSDFIKDFGNSEVARSFVFPDKNVLAFKDEREEVPPPARNQTHLEYIEAMMAEEEEEDDEDEEEEDYGEEEGEEGEEGEEEAEEEEIEDYIEGVDLYGKSKLPTA